MKLTRREALKVAGVAPVLAAAKRPPALQPIVSNGGTRLYPTADPGHWWTTQPIAGWTLAHAVSLGAAPMPDGATMFLDTRNTPLEGVFTRTYFQLVSRPLDGDQLLDGVVSAAIHGIEWHRRIDAALAVQVVVHGPDEAVRGVALELAWDPRELTLGNPPKTRAAENWPLSPVSCIDGDVIAINLGIYANNQSNSLAQGVGFALYANQPGDIAWLDDAEPGNTWVDFSALLQFRIS